MRIQAVFIGLLWLASNPWLATAQQPTQAGAVMSDRGKTELRGPVKKSVTEDTFSLPSGDRIYTTTTTYSLDGKILEEHRRDGDDSDWVVIYTYGGEGRLIKMTSGKANSGPTSEAHYSYDDKGRLIGVSSDNGNPARLEYDDQGRKSVIETYDSKPLPPNTAYAGHWEGTDLGFPPSPGGAFTTHYNENGIATGAELHDASGELLGRIVRNFDERGRIVSEQQTADAPSAALPDDLTSNLNPEQLKSMMALIGGIHNATISYSYDEKGRVTERRRSGGIFGEQTTDTRYNDYGDKAWERVTTIENPEIGRTFGLTEAGAIIPTGSPRPAQPPNVYEVQYTYVYDEHDNWTERTTTSRLAQDAPFGNAKTTRRKLTYY